MKNTKDWFLMQNGSTWGNFMRKAKTQAELRLTKQTEDKNKLFKAQEKQGLYWLITQGRWYKVDRWQKTATELSFCFVLFAKENTLSLLHPPLFPHLNPCQLMF